MKITFVYPDFESLGVAYLMAACRQAGYEVELVFYFSGKSLLDLKKKQRNGFTNVAKQVAATKPHFVAFSCVTDNYSAQLSCAKAIKEIVPELITIFGGFHVTAVPDIVIKEGAVDCIAIGEAENSFINFLKACRVEKKVFLPEHQINGVVFKQRNNLIGEFKEGELADLDSLPFPYKKPFFDSIKFLSSYYSIMTSRGCPYNCSYCFNNYIHSMRGGRNVRQREVDNVISELIHAKNEFSLKYICFVDDCFTTNEAWLLEFCHKYKKEVNLPFYCITISNYLNKTKVDALRAAGCYYVQIGVQSLNEDFCKNVLMRRSDNKKIAEAIIMLNDVGILTVIDHMLGIPGDTIKNQEEAVMFYNQFRPKLINLFYLSYFPKTKITEMAFNKGILNTQDIDDINKGLKPYNLSLDKKSVKEHDIFQGIDLLLRYLPFLPSRFVRFIIVNKIYNKFAIKNKSPFFILATFAGFLKLIFQRKNIVHRQYFFLFLSKFFLSKKIVCKK